MQKCLDLLKKIFVAVLFFRCNTLKCVSVNNKECKGRPEVINTNSNEPLFYPYSAEISKCNDSCYNINGPFVKLCVTDVVKKMNVKVFNLISRTNEAKYIKLHETCKRKCRLHASVCKNKLRFN